MTDDTSKKKDKKELATSGKPDEVTTGKSKPASSQTTVKTLKKDVDTGTVLSSTPLSKSGVIHPDEKHLARQILPVVPIREGVLFPSTESVLTFGRSISLNAIKDSARTKKMVVLLTQRDPEIDTPQPSDLSDIGTLAIVEKTLHVDNSINALVRGIGRVKVTQFTTVVPKLTAEVINLADEEDQDEETEALVKHLQKEFRRAVHMGKPVEFLNFMKLMGGVTNGELVDQIASTLSIKTNEKQALLEMTNVKARLKKVTELLAHEMKVLEIEKDVVHKTQEKFDKHMRDSVLRERLRTIQKELGEMEDDEEIVDEYFKKLKKTKFTKDVKEKVEKEVKRLRSMSPNNPESGYIRTWLDTMFEMPWGVRSDAKVSLEKAEKTLQKNHYGLEEVKDRIIEYIAVLMRRQEQAGTENVGLPTILCFVGPPGVGKTSIGHSIAESLGRKFVKVSLGGIRDEAEIRGHRRTYVGAMPGKMINGIKQTKTMNPVFMLDEIDKIGSDYRGDPSAALLEALDPEQNKEFVDHYLDVPFNFSEVIFITTANTLDTIPPALRDRLEIIRYSGYTEEEKFHIAKDHLLEKVFKSNGMNGKNLKVPNESVMTVIRRYTREAGVRNLERTLSKLARKAARELLQNKTSKKKSITIDEKKLREYLGPEPHDVTLTEEKDLVGLATGLAWTEVGGDVLFIEAALTPGKGTVQLTGKLGDVMKESAQTALTFVKANAAEFGIDPKVMQKTDVHIHVPEGAVPKDGPSAGVTITTAIVSAFTKKAVKREIAMTGEVTLRGRVLRIGGLKEKSIAARRAGSQVVLIPKENERDLEKIPDSVKKDIKFIPVENVRDVLAQALIS